MLATDSGPRTFAQAGRRTLLVIGMTVLPWLVVMLLCSGILASIQFVAYAAVVLLIGYSILRLALSSPAQNLFLAPALGILIVSSVSALCLRLRFPLLWIPALWLGIALIGAVGFWLDRRSWNNQIVPYGWSLAILSLLICLVYFLPSARNDAVRRPDGSFHWMYVDTQHFYAIAANIKDGVEPPAGPGTATQQLRYHFGPYAPAAIISRLTGLDLGDALARLTRGASLWALVLSCFGLGTLLSQRATGQTFGGIMAAAGLFFYGSLLSLFSNEANSASYVTGAILHKIPGIDVVADGGPFSHLVLGHSMLHGLGAVTAIMGLCLALREDEAAANWRQLVALVLPALAIPINSVGGLYSLGIVGTLIFWGHLRRVRSWLSILLMFCLFVAVWAIMGLHNAPDAAGASLKSHIASQWWPIVIGFLAGLGFRILAFHWVSKRWSDPLAPLFLLTLLALLSFALILHLPDDNERYGMYYLQSMFSIFAFSLFPARGWRGSERANVIAEWLRLARNGMGVLIAAAFVIGLVAFVTHTRTGTRSFGPKVALSLFLLLLFHGALTLMKRGPRFAAPCSAGIGCILLIGFLGWITPWDNFGLGRMKLDIVVSPGEVQGLKQLRRLAAPGDRFATNQHVIGSLATRRERSYAYSGLSERPVLLEGYLDRGLLESPVFPALQHDNELMFSTKDPGTLRRTAAAYHIHWLVARPGTDISLSKPLPSWLIAEPDCGSLKIYQIK